MIEKLPKKFKRDLEVLVADYGAGIPLMDYLQQQQEEYFPALLGKNRITDVDWTEEQHVAHAAYTLLDGYALLERAYAVRILEDRPEELARAASTFGRLRYWWGTRDEYDDFLVYANDMLRTLASGDIALYERYTAVTPPFAKTGPHAEKLLHAGITAVISRDRDRLAEAISQYESWKKPKNYIVCLYQTLKGVYDDDPDQVGLGLEAMVNTSRKISQLYDLFKYICLEPHGLYELCRWYNPELVAGFNTQRDLPWDEGLSQWVQGNDGKPTHYDYSELSPELQQWLVDLPFQDCLDHHWS